jgi:HEAT repeat protein
VARARKAALGFVMQRLEDPDAEVRGWATYLASELPYAELIPRLVPRLHDADPVTRASAAHAMGAIARIFRDEVRATVLAMLRAPDPRQRASAMPVVAVLRDASLVSELIRSLGDADPEVVAATHAALVQLTRLDLGSGAWPWVRWWEENRGRHRVEWLIDALTSERLDLRRAAGEELRTLTREYFGYASDLPVHDRQRVQQRYRDWWAVEGRSRFART